MSNTTIYLNPERAEEFMFLTEVMESCYEDRKLLEQGEPELFYLNQEMDMYVREMYEILESAFPNWMDLYVAEDDDTNLEQVVQLKLVL